MDTLYKFVGCLAVWGVATFLLGGGLWLAWHRRPRNPLTRRLGNAWTWVRVFILRKRWHLSLEGARLLLSAYQPKKHLDSWERDIIAASLRYSHRLGWKDPSD